MPQKSKPAEKRTPPSGRCDHCGSAPVRAGDGAALRCDCGSLLARYTALGLELKCRRCKRAVTIRSHEPGVESASE